MMVPRIFPIFIMLPVLILLLLAVIGVIVLSIKLCSKRPWIVVIMALGLLLLIVPFVILIPWHSSAGHYTEVSLPSTLPPSEETTTTIWLPGIEDEFEADVYPSKLSAVRSLGLHIGKPVRQVFGETLPSGIILFKGAHERGLIEEFGRAIARTFPDTQWKVAPETVAVQPDEVGIRVDLVKVQTHAAPWLSGSENEMTSGTIQASVLSGDQQASMKAEFVDKPWAEDFSGFLNTRPNGRFIIAKSTESCMTEAEANQQAVQNACAQVADMLGQTSPRRDGIPISFAKPVNSADILEGGFILDRFVQSFQGTAGKIWRQALLVDASAEKLKNLAQRKAIIARARKRSFAGMFFSIIGLIVLITVVYVFLNAATKGYYVWSLRIAGFVFALVVIIILLV
ncbi:MAG: hypothetical protein WBC05_19745 [Sedimentisphaerales bacterium]